MTNLMRLDLVRMCEQFCNILDYRNRDNNPATEDMSRIVKLMEEMGEVAEAYIGMIGQNPRKGVTHTPDQMLSELADVAITAITAMHRFIPRERVAQILDDKCEQIATRYAAL